MMVIGVPKYQATAASRMAQHIGDLLEKNRIAGMASLSFVVFINLVRSIFRYGLTGRMVMFQMAHRTSDAKVIIAHVQFVVWCTTAKLSSLCPMWFSRHFVHGMCYPGKQG